MKKAFFLVLLLTVVANGLYAKKVKGLIKYNDHTEEVTLKIPAGLFGNNPQYVRLQDGVRYINTDGVTKTLKPSEAEAVKFSIKGETIVLVSVENTINKRAVYNFNRDSHLFLKLVLNGELRLYDYYTEKHTPATDQKTGTISIKQEYLLKLPDSPLKNLKTIGFRKDMMEYFSYCPELVEMLETRTLRKKDIEAIVEFYNQKCSN
ncbi:hypothetical protein LVD15_07830 [Fulvivirga maritima]|uniref:hypothetical protein n=1 Tax=Fulvivirga maritima TaxID=2904247 RepID=UPI001F2790DE|nr:hypothetical protein [Fulvivirga maritima]UII28327.1 hypothetical protein LVD15_07830 [Fulvivirga maritima]